MKSILSISLAFVILLNSLGRVFIVLDYQLNKEYIAKVLCINRAKPKLHCNGKCHLKKQLQKADEHEKKTANGPEGKTEVVLFYQPYAAFRFATHRLTQQPDSPYQSDYAFLFPSRIFHPPTA